MKSNSKLFKKFKKSVKELQKQVVQIGAVGQHTYAKMPNAELLAIHEFGTNDGHIPPRAPIRKTFGDSANLKTLENNIQGLIKVNYEPNKGTFKIPSITDGIGATMKQMVKAKIKFRLSPSNDPTTLLRKRGDIPLIDTGQLVNSIEYGVRTK